MPQQFNEFFRALDITKLFEISFPLHLQSRFEEQNEDQEIKI